MASVVDLHAMDEVVAFVDALSNPVADDKMIEDSVDTKGSETMESTANVDNIETTMDIENAENLIFSSSSSSSSSASAPVPDEYSPPMEQEEDHAEVLSLDSLDI